MSNRGATLMVDLGTMRCPYCGEPYSGRAADAAANIVGCRRCLNVAVIHNGSGAPAASKIESIPPVQELAPEGSVMAQALRLVEETVSELPVLPEVPQRILGMIHDPMLALNEVADLIREDATISLRILRLANSAWVGASHEIKDLRVACSLLGAKAIAKVMHALSYGNAYQARDPAFRDLMMRIWRHSVATAYCLDELAERCRDVRHDAPFAVGLVHDIGKFVLTDIITAKYKGSLGRLREDEALLVRVVDQFAPHVGVQIVQHWGLDPAARSAVAFHHAPDAAPDPSYGPLLHATHLASALADHMGYAISDRNAVDLAELPSAAALRLDETCLSDLCRRAPAQLGPLVEVFSTM